MTRRAMGRAALALALMAAGCAPGAPRDGADVGAVAPDVPATPAEPADAATRPPVSADPAAAATLAAVREAQLTRGRCDDACLAALRDLWAAHAGDPMLRVALINALIERMDWSGLDAVLAAQPTLSDADAVLRAKAQIKLGRFDEAAALLQPLVAAKPDDADLAYNAAFADYYGNRHERAADVLDGAWAALEAAGDANARTLRAMIHLDAGETGPAAAIAEAVVADDPAFFPAWDVLGRARAAEGDEAGAAAAFERVEVIHAANSEVDARRLRLSAQATALREAWAARDLVRAESLVQAMLPEADPALQRQLLEYAAAIFEARGQPEAAATARAAAERLPLGEDGP